MTHHHHHSQASQHQGGCHHHHNHTTQGMRLIYATLLNVLITVVQIVGGFLTNSLSLLSDALHNLGDSSAIMLALWANRYSKKKPDPRHTFGYKRVETLVALFNSTLLIAICLFLLTEAYHRFQHPEQINGLLVVAIASFGLLANLLSVVLLHKNNKENLNMRAAYLHLLGDTLSSVAVMVGGVAIWQWQLYWIDPLITAFVAIYIIRHAYHVVKETVEILLQATPAEVQLDEIGTEIQSLPEVSDIHHVHIWKMGDQSIHFEAHINTVDNIRISDASNIRERIEKLLKEKFQIHHITLQIEHQADCKKQMIACPTIG